MVSAVGFMLFSGFTKVDILTTKTVLRLVKSTIAYSGNALVGRIIIYCTRKKP